MMTNEMLLPFRLDVHFAERVWGRLDLAPWYTETFERPVGEAWLTGGSCRVATGAHAGRTLSEMMADFPEALPISAGEASFPLLVKMLFPQEKLSVQVHPDDADAADLGGTARAKTECWYVLEAEPESTVSLGLKAGTTDAMVRQALGNVGFEALLHQEPVQVGDMIFVQAGTVHAIGAGLVLLEVQQASDTTYRLYDYGRPRELHLDDGLRVIKLANNSGKIAPQVIDNGTRLIEAKHFVVERLEVEAGGFYELRASRSAVCLVGLEGAGVVVTRQDPMDLIVGKAVIVPAELQGVKVAGPCAFVRCAVPSKD